MFSEMLVHLIRELAVIAVKRTIFTTTSEIMTIMNGVASYQENGMIYIVI